MKKVLILDFGKVLAYPTTGYWFLTPCFMETIDMKKIKIEQLLEVMNNYNHILSRKALTQKDEYQLFYDFYKNSLTEYGYPIDEQIIKKLAYNFAYNDDKYRFYDNIEKELEELTKNYTLLMLSDNWPSVLPIMQKKKLVSYFDKMYISSIYGQEKKDGDFFQHPIEEYNLKDQKAIFIDDNESLLDIALQKGLEVRQMDREKVIVKSKHKIIHNLLEIEK